MIDIGRVIALWHYPVSTMAGHEIPALTVTPQGVAGDRQYGLFDRATGQVADPARDGRWRPILEITSRVTSAGALELKLPDGDWQPAETMDEALSSFMGFPVELRRYDEPAPKPGVDAQGARNRYQPSPIHLLTTASLAALKALHPAGQADPRRFRPNVYVEMGERPGSFPETEWIGRDLMIGSERLTITEPTRRCGLTIQSQTDLAHDPDILRHLVRNNGHNIGVYCVPERMITIRTDDRVQLV
jgi:uncharacterized protein YcbX